MSGDRLQAVRALLAAGLVVGWQAAASPLAPVERPEDELLILELRLDGQVLSREMTGYLRDVQDGGGVLLPLGQLVEALDFPIAVEPAEGTAGGWFVRENRRFSLDLERREVVVAGAAGALDPGRVEVHADDLYVDSSLVGEWFPLRVKVDLSRLAVLLEAREKLPLQLRLERRLAWERQARKAGARRAGGARVELPYRVLDWPVLDGTMIAGIASHGKDQEGRTGDVLRHEALLSGDFLAMTAELYLQSGGPPGTSAPGRLKLGRKDPGGRLLGVLGATEVEIGSLFTPERPLLAPGRPARGALLSNHPVDQVEELERATLHGDALPGWEAELYQNESLIDYQVVGDEGRWVFAGVPLLLGMNRFRIVLHGPQGQRKEEVRRLLVGEERVRAGESRYRLTLGELEEEEAGTDGRLFSLDLRRGFERGISAGVSLDSLGAGGERHTYLGLGLRKGAGGTLGRLDLFADSAGGDVGWAGRAALQSRWRSFGVFAQMDRYRGFASAQVSAAPDPPVSRLLLRLDGSAGRGLPASWSVAVEGGERESGAAGLRLTTRVAGSARRLVVGHRGSLAVERHEGGEVETSEASGSFVLSGRGPWGSVRGELGYELEPGARVRDALLSADRNLGRGRALRLGVQRRMAPAPTTRTSVGVTWDFRQVLLGLSLHYDHGAGFGLPGSGIGGGAGGGLSADLSLAYSLRREPLSGRWRLRSVRSAAEGAAAARVFLDEDRDGRFGPGDAPLPGVRFTTGGGVLPGETDEEGIVLLSGLPLYRPVDVGLALGSLEDPAWVPQREGFGLELRPGATPGVEIPVVVSGEVEGTVSLKTGERLVPVAGVELQLVDDRGEVRREARSEFDGFYLFERVPPGRYRVRVAPEQVRRLGLRPVPERAVDIGRDGRVVRGVDLQVERVAVAEGR